MSNDIMKKFNKLKDIIEERKEEKIKYEGRMEQIAEELRTMGFHTVEKARTFVKENEGKIQHMEDQIQSKLDSMIGEYDDVL